MNPPLDPIDQILNAIASAEPSRGFEARLEHAVSLAAQPRPSRRFVYAWASTVLCAIAIGIATHTHRHTASPVPVLHGQEAAPTATATPAYDIAQAIHRRKRGLLSTAAQPARITHENIPEPPLPLTEEERFVLRMMRRNDSPQLAQLSPAARAQHLRDENAAYKDFFAPSPPLNGQPIYVQPIYEQHIISGGSQ